MYDRRIARNLEEARYFLTGSANVMTVPRIAESLAGRIELLQMWPLSQAEIEATTSTFLEAPLAFEKTTPILRPGRAMSRSVENPEPR
jgi:predicted AAA+ superfamily ATPase